MKQTHIFSGSGTAIITPFRDGKIDFYLLERLIEMQIKEKTDALIVCGTTGEAATLSEDERKSVIEAAVKTVGKRIPVIAGTGCNETEKAVSRSKAAALAGADALLIVTPYYNKASHKGLIKHYQAAACASDLPIIVYNVPSRTGIDIDIKTYTELCDIDCITAVKEASGSIAKATELAHELKGRLDIYSGNDDMIVPMLSVGALGVISVVSNILPEKTHRICERWFDGRHADALELQLEMLDLIEALFCEVNPIPIKTALSLIGLCTEEFRLPLCKMEEQNKDRLIAAMKAQGLLF